MVNKRVIEETHGYHGGSLTEENVGILPTEAKSVRKDGAVLMSY